MAESGDGRRSHGPRRRPSSHRSQAPARDYRRAGGRAGEQGGRAPRARSPGGKAESPACRDGYAGFNELYRLAGAEGPRIHEAACWAHVQRKFFDIHAANASPLAAEALRRIGALYDIDARIRGRPPDERRRVRAAESVPHLAALRPGWRTTCAGCRATVRLPGRSAMLCRAGRHSRSMSTTAR